MRNLSGNSRAMMTPEESRAVAGLLQNIGRTTGAFLDNGDYELPSNQSPIRSLYKAHSALFGDGDRSVGGG